MAINIRTRKFERVGPDERIMKMTKIILEQNSKILSMNDHLLRSFLSPMVITLNKLVKGD